MYKHNQSFYYFSNNEQAPEFEIGDEVEFEVVPTPATIRSRWTNDNQDSGASGKFVRGKVISVDPQYIKTKFYADQYGYMGAGEAWFPYTGNDKYTNWQWKRKGYLTKIGGDTKCECGSEKIYGVNNHIHSHWCPKKNV